MYVCVLRLPCKSSLAQRSSEAMTSIGDHNLSANNDTCQEIDDVLISTLSTSKLAILYALS
jgi:hypothetical protein